MIKKLRKIALFLYIFRIYFLKIFAVGGLGRGGGGGGGGGRARPPVTPTPCLRPCTQNSDLLILFACIRVDNTLLLLTV